MPRSDVTLVDNWQVSGLKGTGSTDFEVQGALVPESHTVSLAALDPWPAGDMWKIPLHSLLLPIMGTVPLGVDTWQERDHVGALLGGPPDHGGSSMRPLRLGTCPHAARAA